MKRSPSRSRCWPTVSGSLVANTRTRGRCINKDEIGRFHRLGARRNTFDLVRTPKAAMMIGRSSRATVALAQACEDGDGQDEGGVATPALSAPSGRSAVELGAEFADGGFQSGDLSNGLGVFGAEVAKLVFEPLGPVGRGLGSLLSISSGGLSSGCFSSSVVGGVLGLGPELLGGSGSFFGSFGSAFGSCCSS